MSNAVAPRAKTAEQKIATYKGCEIMKAKGDLQKNGVRGVPAAAQAVRDQPLTPFFCSSGYMY